MNKVLFALGKKPVAGKDGKCAAVEAIKEWQKDIDSVINQSLNSAAGGKSIIFYVHCKSSAYRGAVLQHLLNDAIAQDPELKGILHSIDLGDKNLSKHIVVRLSALMPEEESVNFLEQFGPKDTYKGLDNAGVDVLEAHVPSADYTTYLNPVLAKQQITQLLEDLKKQLLRDLKQQKFTERSLTDNSGSIQEAESPATTTLAEVLNAEPKLTQDDVIRFMKKASYHVLPTDKPGAGAAGAKKFMQSSYQNRAQGRRQGRETSSDLNFWAWEKDDTSQPISEQIASRREHRSHMHASLGEGEGEKWLKFLTLVQRYGIDSFVTHFNSSDKIRKYCEFLKSHAQFFKSTITGLFEQKSPSANPLSPESTMNKLTSISGFNAHSDHSLGSRSTNGQTIIAVLNDICCQMHQKGIVAPLANYRSYHKMIDQLISDSDDGNAFPANGNQTVSDFLNEMAKEEFVLGFALSACSVLGLAGSTVSAAVIGWASTELFTHVLSGAVSSSFPPVAIAVAVVCGIALAVIAVISAKMAVKRFDAGYAIKDIAKVLNAQGDLATSSPDAA